MGMSLFCVYFVVSHHLIVLTRNREEFPALFLASMRRMIDSSSLGTCTLSLCYAFRDDNNGIRGGK